MSNDNKSYRIKANVGLDSYINVQLDQDYDVLEILSLKINETNAYRLHTSDYGVVVGRVLANGGFGVPNAKLSIFIAKESNESLVENVLYPYTDVRGKDSDGVRYNLLPEEQVESCHNPVGTFKSKRYMLDNDNVIEVFDTYYKYTTKTNDAGDYMIFGVPTGQQTLHMDLDISDCGVLSQRPRDFIYKGYTIEQFENANQFKTSDDLDSLPQVFSQNQTIDVKPFWGDAEESSTIGITRADIDVNFKFETTCIFLGSIFTDDKDTGLSPKCKPSKTMGKMSDLETGSGRMEMIRKKSDGSVEEFQIKGTELIDGNGTWCFQIPMNLDYMITDEYGNLVATDNPDRGIATRCRARFRISMGNEESAVKYFQTKVLIPNNPQSESDINNSYEFGTLTPEDEYRDMFWNNVYSVKSYIPRLQNSDTNPIVPGYKKFIGIKSVNDANGKNPIPYNHIRMKFPFIYTVICAILNFVLWIVKFLNRAITVIQHFICWLRDLKIVGWHPFASVGDFFSSYITLGSNLCEQLDGTYVIPGAPQKGESHYGDKEVKRLIMGTYKQLYSDNYNTEGTTISPVGGNGYMINLIDDDGGYWGFITGTSLSSFTAYYFGDGTKDKKSYYGTSEHPEYGCSSASTTWMKVAKESTSTRNGKQVSASTIVYDQGLLYKVDYENGKAKEWYFRRTEAIPTYSEYEDTDDTQHWLAFSTYNKGSYYSKWNKTTGITDKEIYVFDIGPTVNKLSYFLAIPLQCPYNTYDKLKEYLSGNSISSFISNKYSGSTEVEGQESADTICLTSDGDFLMECVEMALAEDYQVINFDFYNDWLNGSIYLPRWERQIRGIRKKIKSCSSDVSSNRKRLYLGNMNGTYYTNGTNQYTAKVHGDNDAKTWRINGRVAALSQKYIVTVTKSKLTGANIYYLMSQDGNTYLFKTDIILLGALNDCNIYGIPAIPETIPSTTYQMPDDLAQTSYQNDEQGNSWGKTGCISVSDIATSSAYESFWSAYTGASAPIELNLSADDSTYWAFTEEAGISWNYTGPNQLTEGNSIDTNSRLYSPGGHFLGLACGALNSLTNFRTNVNLIRACEYGVSLSERMEIPGLYSAATQYDYYLVPNGLISRDNIYDHNYRAQFATMNFNGLATELDENTGYLRYKMNFMYPNNFDGIFDSSASKSKFTGQVILTEHSDATSGATDEFESGHTYSRIREDFNTDYARFRYGTTTPRLLSSSQQLARTENSYYFYFGLNKGNTAIDTLRKDYFAVCERSVENEYSGTISYMSGYTDECKTKRYFAIQTNDVSLPMTLSITDSEGNDVTTSVLRYIDEYPESGCVEGTTWKSDCISTTALTSTTISSNIFGVYIDNVTTKYTLMITSSDGYILSLSFEKDEDINNLEKFDYQITNNIANFRCSEFEISEVIQLTGESREDYGGYYRTSIPLEDIKESAGYFSKNWCLMFNDTIIAKPGFLSNTAYQTNGYWHIPITALTSDKKVSVKIYNNYGTSCGTQLIYNGEGKYEISYPTLKLVGKYESIAYSSASTLTTNVDYFVINNLMIFNSGDTVSIQPGISGGTGLTIYLYGQPEQAWTLYSGNTIDAHNINVSNTDIPEGYSLPTASNNWAASYPSIWEGASELRNHFELYALDNVGNNKNKPATAPATGFFNVSSTSFNDNILTIKASYGATLEEYRHYVLYDADKNTAYPIIIDENSNILIQTSDSTIVSSGDNCRLYHVWLVPIYYRPQDGILDIVIATERDNEGKIVRVAGVKVRERITQSIIDGKTTYSNVCLSFSNQYENKVECDESYINASSEYSEYCDRLKEWLSGSDITFVLSEEPDGISYNPLSLTVNANATSSTTYTDKTYGDWDSLTGPISDYTGKTGNNTVTIYNSGDNVRILEYPVVPVTGITLDKEDVNIKLYETYTVTATISPSDASIKDITWTSSNVNVADVDDGDVITYETGSTIITATSVDNPDVSEKCRITIEE